MRHKAFKAFQDPIAILFSFGDWVVFGAIFGACLFPIAQFDEKEILEEMTTVIAQMESITAFVNDLLSLYKELLSPRARNPRDQNNLVMNYCHVEGTSLRQAFDRSTDDTINGVRRIQELFDGRERRPSQPQSMSSFEDTCGGIYAIIKGTA